MDQLVNQVAHWTPARWAAGGAGDRVHALAQRLADLGADAEQREHRPVPRLDSDLALPDQVRVLAADLLAADPPPGVLAAALDAVRHARAGL
ncbi:MAG TPA: hypothetical protein VHA75_07035 [Rugosimonospora sp.]|nr:hypothetical protein [Rugosimonospora sp.]